MSEYMTEQLIKRKTTVKDTAIKFGLIALTALSLLLSGNMIFMVLFVVLLIVDYYVLRRMDVEYEYTYFGGELDIAKVMNKQFRKEVFTTNVKEEMELIAPSDHGDLKYHQVQKTLDFSSKFPEHKTYTMVTLYKGQKVKVIIEPNEKLLNNLKDTAPRKVIF
ncbi:MAG: DUF6106 family protein [Faecalimonas sp.]|nr:DUF6106 family protein [Faecalimonas sp.]